MLVFFLCTPKRLQSYFITPDQSYSTCCVSHDFGFDPRFPSYTFHNLFESWAFIVYGSKLVSPYLDAMDFDGGTKPGDISLVYVMPDISCCQTSMAMFTKTSHALAQCRITFWSGNNHHSVVWMHSETYFSVQLVLSALMSIFRCTCTYTQVLYLQRNFMTMNCLLVRFL